MGRRGVIHLLAPERSADSTRHRPRRVMCLRLDHPDAGAEKRSKSEGENMAIGPVQLIVLGFNHPDFHGEVIAELERLRASDTVRVIDSLAVYKDADGELEVEHLSNLTQEEAIELGTKIGALVGIGFDGEEGAEEYAAAGADAAAGGIHVFEGEEWDVLSEIPPNSAAALILL